MKTLRLLALLVAAAMFLVACGTGDNGNGNGDDDPVVTTGTLFVNVNVPATVTVLDSDGVQVDEVANTQAENWDVEAGDYTVQAEAQGYGSQSEPVTITAGQSSTVNFSLVPDTVQLGDVETVEIVGFVDENGDPYDWNLEINPVKDATLVAAQTEEQVGVVVRALDAAGDPVAGAPVTISITGDFSDALAIYPGKASDVMPSAAQTFTGLTTDADGYAFFVIEATNAFPTWQDILNDFGLYGPRGVSDVQVSQDIDVFGLEPVKLIVSSLGGDMIAKRSEFKAWFVNMSHLWYGEPDADDDLDDDSLVYTEQRLGADLGEIFNIWIDGPGADNRHDFGTFAITKQPSSDPFAVGYDMFGFFEYLGNSLKAAGPAMVGFGAPGWMVYTISGDTDLVEWDNCDFVSADGLTCEDAGTGVSLVPLASVDLEDLPISITVEATYVFEVPYGSEWYEFELKSYTFTKTWIGGYLEVDKYVDQHVLTWYGSDITLPASSPTYGADYVSRVFVTVSNPSQSVMYNVTVTDAVPSELGVVTGGISDAGTYDATNHTVTWNNVPALASLAPNESVTVSFDVYARHKPGYCWEGVGGGSFVVQPTGDAAVDGDCALPYNDPYRVINGFQQNTVSAAAFFEPGVTGQQLVFSYTPAQDESDIWVVRPFLTLEKTLKSADVMVQNAAATFELQVGHRDRVSTVTDPASTEYTFLADAYPWAFGGALGTGTGHEAGSSTVRENPYARDIQVYDSFEVGLDFTQGTDFDGTLIFPSDTTKVVGKDITFSVIDDLKRGELATAQVTLQGVLISDDGTGTSQNNAEAILVTDDLDLFAWQNCAYLGAPQLNQPFPFELDGLTLAAPFAYTIYAGFLADPATYPLQGTSNLWLPSYFQIDPDLYPATDLVGDATDGADPLYRVPSFGTTGKLEDCAIVVVIPGPVSEPFMTLTTNGEYAETVVSPTIVEANLRDGYQVGDSFVYKMTAQNAGAFVAQDVDVDFTNLTALGAINFTGNAILFAAPSASGPWQQIQSVAPVLNTTVDFAPVDVPAGHFLRVVIPAQAAITGIEDIESNLNYTNPPTSQNLPLQVIEQTSVQ